MPEDNEQKPADQPQRLQNLSARGGRGGMRGGRFLPNAVGRRSKEERESSAPAMKPQPHSPDANKQPKKFERRKQRQLGTRAEAAGPLAAPTIASTSAARPIRASGTATSAGSTGGVGVRVKAEDSAIAAALASDVRIDMSAAVEDRDSFIPLRMPKDNFSKPGSAARGPQHDPALSNDEKSGASPDQVASRERVGGAEGDAEEKHAEGGAHLADTHRDATQEGSLGSSDTTEARLRFAEDDLYFFHLPGLGLTVGEAPATSPLHQSEPGTVKIKDEEPSAVATTSTPATGAAPADEEGDVVMGEPDSAPPLVGAAGRLGTLRTHASGKMTMLIGDVVYEVLPGSHNASAEELVILNESTRLARPLGSVKSRVLVVPDLDALHI